jgi:23S rRNA (adenine2503-C2)-methyltransferase
MQQDQGERATHVEGLPITLAVSLHAPRDDLHSQLVPLTLHYPITELLEACRAYVARTRRRITFEYVLLAGLNDTPEEAHGLGRLVRGLRGSADDPV